MEETNPWLDSEEVKHVNKPTVKPERTYLKTDHKKKHQGKKNDSFDNGEKSKNKIFFPNIKKDENITSFLQTLLEELDFLPEQSKKFAIETFGEEWLSDFIEEVKDVQTDILKSKFFPSQDKMILLKLIFLLQQANN